MRPEGTDCYRTYSGQTMFLLAGIQFISICYNLSAFIAIYQHLLYNLSGHAICNINPRPDRGWVVQPPWGFFADSETIKWRRVAPPGFVVHYGANLAQLLVKKLTRSDQVTELWRHKRNNLWQFYWQIRALTIPTWRDATDANDNIWTWLGQDIARVRSRLRGVITLTYDFIGI